MAIRILHIIAKNNTYYFLFEDVDPIVNCSSKTLSALGTDKSLPELPWTIPNHTMTFSRDTNFSLLSTNLSGCYT